MGFGNEIIGFVMKCLFNDSFPPDKVEKGSFRMVQNIRVPKGSVNILIESDCHHNAKLMSYGVIRLISVAVLLCCRSLRSSS